MAPIPQSSMRGPTFQDAIVQSELVSVAELARAERAAREGAISLQKSLLTLGLIDEDALVTLLSEWLEIPCLTPSELHQVTVQKGVLSLEFATRSGVVLLKDELGTELLAMVDPLNEQVFQSVSFKANRRLKKAVLTEQTLRWVLAQQAAPDAPDDEDRSWTGDIARVQAVANDAPVVQSVNNVLGDAIKERASDIHFEQFADGIHVRLRIDGALSHHRRFSADLAVGIIARLKVLSRLNTSERRLPQDSRFRVAIRGRDVDFRISTLPTEFGESVVLRVLDQAQLALDWSALGITQQLSARIEALTQAPHGLFLVTGPTGSGKTTTLYTALSKLDIGAVKVATVEDPIEYSLPGINQTEVHPEVGLTFATALRAILRQDPNTVMIGEIRDVETAENAIRAALMGRMVLSTLHTNSAVDAIDRLLDLGVPSYLLAATLRGILSQRLVRRLCNDCEMCIESACSRCHKTGYFGRTALAELLEIDRHLAAEIASGLRGARLLSHAEAQGHQSLKADGERLIKAGVTSPEEVWRVVEV